MEMTRCFLHEKGLPKKFWAQAANTVRSVSVELTPNQSFAKKKTPFEAWFGYKPLLLKLKTFG